MFNESEFQSMIAAYKNNLPDWWRDEQFKWQAIKCFQDNWNINATNFAEMLDRSLAKTSNLLTSYNHFPKAMITEFATAAPEEVRAMFVDLFDESRDVVERIDRFKAQSAVLLKKYKDGAANHYQDENAISTYLWLRYPDKYYIYKFSEVKAVASELGFDYTFKKGAYADNMRNFLKLYDEINTAVKKDNELADLLKAHLTDDCYPDPELKTLTIDIGFYISRSHPAQDTDSEWIGLDYDPDLSVENWAELLRNPEVFTPKSLEIVRRMKDYGGEATCTQLAQKYGENKNFYNSGSVGLARRVCDAAGIEPNTREDGSAQWWTVLYIGRYADADEEGSFVWKLRDELSKALDGFDLSGVRLYTTKKDKTRYWLCAPGDGACIWDECVRKGIIAIGWDEIGDYRQYHSKAEIAEKLNDVLLSDKNYSTTARAIIEFLSVMKLGDVIFAKKGTSSVIGRGVVEGDYEFDDSRSDYKNIRRVRWTDIAEYPYPETAPQKTLTDITDREDIVTKLNEMYDAETSSTTPEAFEPYTKSDFLSDVYMSEESYDSLVRVLTRKKNIILQGAPGVGKTFAARRLAWSIMGEKDNSRIEQVQFHQNYSYEDFVMGYKPNESGFRLTSGVFFRFCQKASNRPYDKFFFIIDEINRGNMSKIFGELLMLIENDYRGKTLTLVYDGRPFSVPKNLYIIGMMNTADRSLAMIDYALRRRFSFFEMEPAFDSESFKKHQAAQNSEKLDKLIEVIKKLNDAVTKDRSLGEGFRIGHSYFCFDDENVCTDENLRAIVDYDIIPTLKEYWFDDPSKVKEWKDELNGALR